jgi:hypothetical protein
MFSAEDGTMATKMKLYKMLQEVKGLAKITNRRPAPRPPLLYLMQLRSHIAHADTPKRRLTIEEVIHEAHPIKIHHVNTNKPGLPVVVG